MHRLAMHKSRM